MRGQQLRGFALMGEVEFDTLLTAWSPGGEFASYPVKEARPVGDKGRREYLVAPGTAVSFSWGIGCTIKEWTEKYDAPDAAGGELVTHVWSYGDAGTVDTITFEFRARPLRPRSEGIEHWKLVDSKDDAQFGITTRPAKRKWLFEERDSGEAQQE